MSLLSELRGRGLKVELAGNRLILSPANLVTLDVEELVKAHKDKIIAEVKQEVECMTLEAFAGSVLAVKIFSKDLGEDIFLCSCERAAQMVRDEGLVAYLPDELMAILQAHPNREELVQIHEVKKSFNGRVKK